MYFSKLCPAIGHCNLFSILLVFHWLCMHSLHLMHNCGWYLVAEMASKQNCLPDLDSHLTVCRCGSPIDGPSGGSKKRCLLLVAPLRRALPRRCQPLLLTQLLGTLQLWLALPLITPRQFMTRTCHLINTLKFMTWVLWLLFDNTGINWPDVKKLIQIVVLTVCKWNFIGNWQILWCNFLEKCEF